MNLNIYKNIKKQGDLVFLCLILFFGLALNKMPIAKKKKEKELNEKEEILEVSIKGQQNINGWQFERVTGLVVNQRS